MSESEGYIGGVYQQDCWISYIN